MRVKTEYYEKVYKPNNWHYSLQMIMAREKKFLGVVTLYRNIGKDDFSHDDVFLVDTLKDHMAYRLWQQKQNRVQFGRRLRCQQLRRSLDLPGRSIIFYIF